MQPRIGRRRAAAFAGIAAALAVALPPVTASAESLTSAVAEAGLAGVKTDASVDSAPPAADPGRAERERAAWEAAASVGSARGARPKPEVTGPRIVQPRLVERSAPE